MATGPATSVWIRPGAGCSSPISGPTPSSCSRAIRRPAGWHPPASGSRYRVPFACGSRDYEGPPRSSLGAVDDLPAGQKLDAEEGPTDLQRPATHSGAPELLNLHGKRHRHRMATGNRDELPRDVQDHDLAFHAPARNLAPDVARKCAAVLVNAIDVPRGRAVGIKRHPHPERGSPCCEPWGLHLRRATPVDGRHHGVGPRVQCAYGRCWQNPQVVLGSRHVRAGGDDDRGNDGGGDEKLGADHSEQPETSTAWNIPAFP